jgi:hypothetical protein
LESQTALTFEYIFSGITIIFVLLWIVPMLTNLLSLPSDPFILISYVFLNPYFILAIIFAIPAEIFSAIKKGIDKKSTPISQQQKGPGQQQQQQQLITVNIPAQPIQTQPKSGLPSIPTSDSMFCIHCGSQNLKIAKFCKVCGATIE